MLDDLDYLLDDAIAAHEAEDFKSATLKYTQILANDANHADANHNFGLLKVEVGLSDEALILFQTAINTNPNVLQYWITLINTLINIERFKDAEYVLEQADFFGHKEEVFYQLRHNLEIKRRLVMSNEANNYNQNLGKNNPEIRGELKLDQAIKLAKIKAKNGLEWEAKQIYDNILQKFPKNQRARNGINALSEKVFSSIPEIKNPSEGQIELLINSYNNGHYNQTVHEALKLQSKFPTSFIIYNILGLSNFALGKLDCAIDFYNSALSLKPDYSEVYNNMGTALQQQGKVDEALECYTKALSFQPDYATALYNMGVLLQNQGKHDEAQNSYNKALLIKPDYPEAINNLGVVLHEKGNLEDAITSFSKALLLKPDYADACNNKGNALKDLSKLDDAMAAYNKALSIKPDYSEVYNNMAVLLQEQGKLVEALESYNKALLLNPNDPEIYNNMGAVLKDQGRLDEALQAYNKAISLKPDYSEAHRNKSTIIKYAVNDKHLLEVEKQYSDAALTDYDRCNLCFALAKMYEDIGDLDKAFTYLSLANKLRKKQLGYSIDLDKKLFVNLRKTQPILLKTRLEKKEISVDTKPIFIIGMPRSGTTLVEQIIASHSKVLGAGELEYIRQLGGNLAVNPESISNGAILEFRNRYLSELSKLSSGQPFVTDKMPQNFCFIPLIVAALPEAKIIHVQRNAAATCWSNFKKYFVKNGLGFSYDLSDTVEYYKLYADLIELWQSQYRDKIYNLNYEKLTTDQENETRKLINHLDLNWEKACLSPHENKRSVRTASQQQVRKKLYQGSSTVWRRYEPYLNGVFDCLPSN